MRSRKYTYGTGDAHDVSVGFAMTSSARFRAAYAEHRRSEGRGSGGISELSALPYLRSGLPSLVRQWEVRARSYEAFSRRIIAPAATRVAPRNLRILDLGAGNAWLCYRMSRLGHDCVALDWRSDAVDGLGAARQYSAILGRPLKCVAGSFDAIPTTRAFDIAVFNAAIHYATALDVTIGEATRTVRSGGRIVILDSPFYQRAQDGERMMQEKKATALKEWGPNASDLLALPMIEYLTPERLQAASAIHGLEWKCHAVRYPLWYRVRPMLAVIRRRRPPSRFAIWEATVP